MKTLTDVIKSLVEGLEETSKERLQKYSVAAKKDVRIRGLNLKPGDEKEKKKVINRYKGIQTAQDKLKKGSYNESTDIVESSGPYLVGIFRKGSDKFLLWQVSTKSYDCYLTTTQSAKTGWEFKKVVSFKDGVDDAVEKLKKDGYKDITMINESINLEEETYKVGDEIPYTKARYKKILSQGYPAAIIGVGGGYSDTSEFGGDMKPEYVKQAMEKEVLPYCFAEILGGLTAVQIFQYVKI